MKNRDGKGLWVALLLAAIVGFHLVPVAFMFGQTTDPVSVPVDVQLNVPGSVLYATTDTVKVTYYEKVGNPLAFQITNTDSMYKYHNENKTMSIVVAESSNIGAQPIFNLKRTITGPSGVTRDTAWIRGDSVYNSDVFGDQLDWIFTSTVTVGDHFLIYFRTLQPLKVDGNRLLQIDMAKPDSVQTWSNP